MYCSWNCPHLRYHHATWTDPEEYLCKIQNEPDDCTYALAEDEAEALELVTRSGWTLVRVPEYLRTAEICLAAVRQERRGGCRAGAGIAAGRGIGGGDG